MKSTLELLTALSVNPWFGALPLSERRATLAASEPLRLRLRQGEMLSRQGDKVAQGHGAFYDWSAGAFPRWFAPDFDQSRRHPTQVDLPPRSALLLRVICSIRRI